MPTFGFLFSLKRDVICHPHLEPNEERRRSPASKATPTIAQGSMPRDWQSGVDLASKPLQVKQSTWDDANLAKDTPPIRAGTIQIF
jgi:hypothetical protein